MVRAGVEDVSGQGERVRRLRSTVTWCETAADLLAWRVRCETEGRPLQWAGEVAKGRAVLMALKRLGLVPPDGFDLLEGVVLMPAGLADPAPLLTAVEPILLARFEDLVPSLAAGMSAPKSVAIRAAVGRGLLGSVARLVVEDILARQLDAFMCATVRFEPGDALKKRAADAEPTDRVIARAAAAEEKGDPETALAGSISALAAARGMVTTARVDVASNQAWVNNERQAMKRAKRAIKNTELTSPS